jgi:glutamine amidotransferase
VDGAAEYVGPLAGLPAGAYAYFVHSYVAEPAPEAAAIVASTTDYGGRFVSALARDNIWGTQFHPEKSGAIGAVVLRNFVRRCSPGAGR